MNAMTYDQFRMSNCVELTPAELDLVGGASWSDVFGGVIGVGGGAAAIGTGLEMTGLAAGLVIGGGAIAVVGGVALAAYGVYELTR